MACRAGGVAAPAVVVATPAFAAAPLLAPHAPGAADLLTAIDHASVALVALAVPRAGIDRELDGSGFLVPRSAGLLTTACSWVTSKWPHLAVDPDLVVLRASVGRAGDDRAVTLDDDALVRGVLADLETTMGLRAAADRRAHLALAPVVPPAAPRPPRSGGGRSRPTWPPCPGWP